MVRRNVNGVNAHSDVRVPCASGCVVGLFLGRPLGRLSMLPVLSVNTDIGSSLGDIVVIFVMSRRSVRGRPLPPLPVLPLERPEPRGRPLPLARRPRFG